MRLVYSMYRSGTHCPHAWTSESCKVLPFHYSQINYRFTLNMLVVSHRHNIEQRRAVYMYSSH